MSEPGTKEHNGPEMLLTGYSEREAGSLAGPIAARLSVRLPSSLADQIKRLAKWNYAKPWGVKAPSMTREALNLGLWLLAQGQRPEAAQGQPGDTPGPLLLGVDAGTVATLRRIERTLRTREGRAFLHPGDLSPPINRSGIVRLAIAWGIALLETEQRKRPTVDRKWG